MKNKLLIIVSVILVICIIFGVSATAQETLGEDSMIIFDEQVTEIPSDPSEPGGEPQEPPTEPEDPDVPGNPENPDTPDNPDNPDNPDTPDIPDTPEEPEPPKPTFDEIPGDTIVGRMYICSEIVFLGHSWIYIESTFDGEMPVGCYTVAPFGSVSVGTFLMSRRDGMGVYYNVERYSATKFGLKSANWLGMDITKDQLMKVNKEIKDWNYWDLYFNCTFFASKVWNSVSDKFFMPMMFPVFTKAQANTKGGNKNVTMQTHDNPEDCFKQRGTGNGARLETVSSGSLKTRIG